MPAPPIEAPVIVYQDAHWLVLNKPSGLPTTSPDPNAPTLVREAARLDPGAPRLHASSRLDAEVSGMVTFARTVVGNDALLCARREGNYDRLYLGLTLKPPQPLAGRWDAPISLDAADRRKRKAGSGKGEKQALTLYRVVQSADASLVALWPQTGRTHQLRVHAAHAGCALLGDKVYGGQSRATMANGRVVTARRTMLHCTRLNILRPDGNWLKLSCPPPEDFESTWERLGGALDHFFSELEPPN